MPDEASEVEGEGEDVTEEGGFGRVVEAEEGGAFEMAASLIGVAGFSIGEATDAQVPGGRVDLEVSSQADGAIGEAQGGGHGETEGMLVITVRAESAGWGLVRGREVRLRAMSALLAADPLGLVALVIVTIAVQTVAVGAEGSAVFVETTLETSEGVVIARGVA